MKQTTPTIGILGAGAVGSYLVMGLSEKYKENLWVIADGERKKRLEENGLNINDQHYILNVKTPGEAHGVDFLFVCLKYTQLRSSLPDIEAIADKHTTVISLLNGVDSEEIIGQRIGMEHMIYSLIRIASQRIGNSIHFPVPKGYNGIYVGLPNQPASQDPRLLAIADIFADTPIVLHLHQNEEEYMKNILKTIPEIEAFYTVGIHKRRIDEAEFQDAFRKMIDRNQETTVCFVVGSFYLAGMAKEFINQEEENVRL